MICPAWQGQAPKQSPPPCPCKPAIMWPSQTVIFKVGRTASITQHAPCCPRKVPAIAGESASIPLEAHSFELPNILLALGHKHTHLRITLCSFAFPVTPVTFMQKHAWFSKAW